MKTRIIFIFVPLLTALCFFGCAADTAPESKGSPSLADSAAYINLNALEANENSGEAEFFIPVSYVKSNEQILVGESLILSSDKRFSDVPKADKMNKASAKNMFSTDSSLISEPLLNENVIATNGDWDLFLDKVKYTKYDLNNRPNEKSQNEYFKNKLSAYNSENTDIIITETWAFEIGGKKAAIVNAGNVLISGKSEIIYDTENKYKEQLPEPLKGCVMYSFSALFIENGETVSIYEMVQEIADVPLNNFLEGVSFLPPNNEDSFQQIYSVALLNKDKSIAVVPVFNSHGGALIIRDFSYRPNFLLCDIDGDEKSELICYIKRTSSVMSYCEVYKLDKDKPEKVLAITLN